MRGEPALPVPEPDIDRAVVVGGGGPIPGPSATDTDHDGLPFVFCRNHVGNPHMRPLYPKTGLWGARRQPASLLTVPPAPPVPPKNKDG